MTAASFTGNIQTNNEFVTVESVADDFTFTAGKTYTMQIQNTAELKISDAIFTISDEKFTYKAGTDDLYINTPLFDCVLTILENEESA